MEVDIVNLLTPSSLSDFFAYGILLLSLATLFAMPEKNNTPLYIMYVVIFFAVLDLLRGDNGELFSTIGATFYGGGSGYLGFGNQGFGTMFTHLGMGLLPLVGGAMIRRRGKQGRFGMPLAFLTGIVGMVYTIGAFTSPQLFY